jgi:hypothetical protein
MLPSAFFTEMLVEERIAFVKNPLAKSQGLA